MLVRAIYDEVQQRFAESEDQAHNWQHVQRVYENARALVAHEPADRFIVTLAALLHDLGRLGPQEKGLPHAERSARLSVELLERYSVPEEKREGILHAIRAHSFKQGIAPQTPEASIVRDADRLDALGAVGIMRWAVSTSRRRHISNYDALDPFAERREPDEQRYMLDRFYTKLLTLEGEMLTTTGRALARERIAFMRAYLDQFRRELEAADSDVRE
jgi:uncharacterized protein